MRPLLNIIDFTFRKILKAVIKLYRLFISPILGNNCRFYPTCSQYALDALNKKTFIKAMPLITKRVLKCHPFHSGGYDPVK
ncbi:membrane protein insertion efficiency factor YidD [bacterium]|nr:membrane protein insertion efficiency factor YidD [bacterium]